MNPIKLIQNFLEHFENNRSLKHSHLSLYLALCNEWQKSGFKNPVYITRQELMKSSKIHSTATYHKCIKELHLWEIITYKPSFDPYRGSRIFMKLYN